ncbi:MAG TPA: VanW family protein [Candidatus Gracilibacteria bacterium]
MTRVNIRYQISNIKYWCLIFGICHLLFIYQAQAQTVPDEMFLIFDHQILRVNFETQPGLLQTSHQHFLQIGNQKIPLALEGRLLGDMDGIGEIKTEFVTEISPQKLKNFLEEAAILKPHDPKPVEINMDGEGNIIFEGKPQAGYQIDFDKLIALIDEGLAYGYNYIRVPAKQIYSDVVVHPDLYARGIKEIIAVGESNFRGSSIPRKQNIKAASQKFNGQIIEAGRLFSFNEILEDVNEEDGFVKELVIKGNETTKELGGGVCQVSTTAFRAAVNGGFPITDRKNHSYAVPYYKPFGLDAAIYLGVTDMRFRNDTPGDMLVQTLVDGDNLYFIFYGTNDDRQVSLEGPFISDIVEPKDPIVLESEDLPSGEMKMISEAHKGFEAEWVRRIKKDGEVTEETIKSYYRPWPARVEVGTFNPKVHKRVIRERKNLFWN